jgi:glyceraldehyde 3-phosphate dehydrogenase
MTETLTKNAISKSSYEAGLSEWIEYEKSAIELINVIGNLWFDKSVELIIFRNQLVDRSASEILNLHLYAKNIVKQPITIKDTLLLAKEINKLDLAPSRIDVGRLGAEWLAEKDNFPGITEFVHNKLINFIGKDKRVLIAKDVVLYGFGRIGRILAR